MYLFLRLRQLHIRLSLGIATDLCHVVVLCEGMWRKCFKGRQAKLRPSHRFSENILSGVFRHRFVVVSCSGGEEVTPVV